MSAVTDTNIAVEEDVIAALRLAQIANEDDFEKFGRVAARLLEEAPATPDTNRGGVALLIELHKNGSLKFEVDC